jgi:small subunit ribosomal protein S5
LKNGSIPIPESQGQVVAINRVTKVVKGGKNMSFSALVVVGDPQAKVVGYGSARPRKFPRIEKGIRSGQEESAASSTARDHDPHQSLGRFGSGLVLLKPAKEGTGSHRRRPGARRDPAVGIPNVLTKSIGTHNPHNVVQGTVVALEQLRDKAVMLEMRGLTPEKA